ncbi:MAG: 50S ribosomal protein L17 [Spirochaetota bacterium]
MRHLKATKKLGRDKEHRNAMFANMMVSFFEQGIITTTLAKAKELRRLSEKIITRAKVNTLHNKRIVLRRLKNRDVVAKLFDTIAPVYKDVHGGYTRILRLGKRMGDGAEMSIIELVTPKDQLKGDGAKKEPVQKVKAQKQKTRKAVASKGKVPASGEDLKK